MGKDQLSYVSYQRPLLTKEKITFQIIDRAIPPKKTIKPKIRLNVILAGVVSFVAGIFLIFFLEYLSNLKEPKEKGGEDVVNGGKNYGH